MLRALGLRGGEVGDGGADGLGRSGALGDEGRADDAGVADDEDEEDACGAKETIRMKVSNPGIELKMDGAVAERARFAPSPFEVAVAKRWPKPDVELGVGFKEEPEWEGWRSGATEESSSSGEASKTSFAAQRARPRLKVRATEMTWDRVGGRIYGENTFRERV